MGEKKLKIVDIARETGVNRGTVTRLYHETASRVELEVVAATYSVRSVSCSNSLIEC